MKKIMIMMMAITVVFGFIAIGTVMADDNNGASDRAEYCKAFESNAPFFFYKLYKNVGDCISDVRANNYVVEICKTCLDPSGPKEHFGCFILEKLLHVEFDDYANLGQCVSDFRALQHQN
jgi:hypothetical protein